jgi:hypothetical protein
MELITNTAATTSGSARGRAVRGTDPGCADGTAARRS